MAKLINGDGNKAIWAAQDADLIAALAGDVTGIAKVGNKYAATQEDANTIGLSDGVIVTKEGRRIQLDTGNVDLFDIPTGTTGVTNYYIIGYHLFTNSDSSQECETFVQKMDNGTDVIVENTFKGGATEVYVSLYRITQVGLNISLIDALLSELDNISALNSALSNMKKASVDTGVVIWNGTGSAPSSYVAPSDGYLWANIASDNKYMQFRLDNKMPTAFAKYAGIISNASPVFIRKGTTVTNISSNDTSGDTILYFHPLV